MQLRCFVANTVPLRVPRARSFTLIELLVVIAILGILMAIAVYGVLSAIEGGRISKAKQTIEQLRSAIDGYESRFHQLPFVSLNEYDQTIRHNTTNNGIETLLVALRTTEGGRPLLDITQFEGSLENRDGDRSPQAYNLFGVDGDPQLFELVDPWGNPYVYVPQALDNEGDPYRRTYNYIDANGDHVVIDPQVWARNSTTGVMPQKFMLWSFGPSGVNMNGLGDDIISWQKGDAERNLRPDDLMTSQAH